MTIKNKKTPHKKHLLLLIIGTLVVGILSVLAYWLITTRNQQPPASTTDYTNYSPPTVEEQKAGDEKKTEIDPKNETPPDIPPANTAEAHVIITFADLYQDNVEVGARVANVFEDGGSCKLTLKSGSAEQTVTVAAVKNVSSTDCPTMSIAKSKLSPGAWTATVTYTSSSHTGTSEPKTITVS